MVSRPDVSLSVGVSNRTKRGLAGVERSFNATGTSIGKRFGSVMSGIGAGVGVALGAAGAAVVAFGAKTFAEADRVGKLATQTGITVEGIQRLSHAAQIGGTDIESLAKAQGRLTRVISDAGNGLATAERSVAQLGLSYQQLAAASPEQQLHMVADALTLVDDASKRSALAQELFGRAGREMLSVIGDQPGALRAVGDELDNVLSTEQVRDAEEFNDVMAELTAELTTVAQSLVLELAPALTAVAGKLLELSENAGQFVDAAEPIVRWGGRVLDWAIPLDGAWKGLSNTGRVLTGDVGAIDDALVGYIETIPAAELATDGIRAAWDWLTGSGEDLEHQIRDVDVAAHDSTLSAAAWEDAYRTAQQRMLDAADAQRDVWAAIDAGSFDTVRRGVQDLAVAYGDLALAALEARWQGSAQVDELGLAGDAHAAARALYEAERSRLVDSLGSAPRGRPGGGGRVDAATEETVSHVDLVRDSIDGLTYLQQDTYRETRDQLKAMVDQGEISQIDYWRGVERLDRAYEREGRFFAAAWRREGDESRHVAQGTTTAVVGVQGAVEGLAACMPACGPPSAPGGSQSVAGGGGPWDSGQRSPNERTVTRVEDGRVYYRGPGGGEGSRTIDSWLSRPGGAGRDELQTFLRRLPSTPQVNQVVVRLDQANIYGIDDLDTQIVAAVNAAGRRHELAG